MHGTHWGPGLPTDVDVDIDAAEDIPSLDVEIFIPALFSTKTPSMGTPKSTMNCCISSRIPLSLSKLV